MVLAFFGKHHDRVPGQASGGQRITVGIKIEKPFRIERLNYFFAYCPTNMHAKYTKFGLTVMHLKKFLVQIINMVTKIRGDTETVRYPPDQISYLYCFGKWV